VRGLRQLAVLASAVRQELVDAFAAHGPCAIADLAPLLGRTPESLYFHVRKLLAVGLLRGAGRRRRGSREEALYRTPGRRMVLDVTRLGPRRREALIRIVQASLRLVPRDVTRGMRAPGAVMAGPARTVYSARVQGWLSAAERARIVELFEAIERVMSAARPGPGRTLTAVAIALAPGAVRTSRAVATRREREG
jgi:hypothetical protein